MFKVAKSQLLRFTFALIAPILLHSSFGGELSILSLLLLEFVDAYAAIILLLTFIIVLVLLRNLFLRAYLFFRPKKGQKRDGILRVSRLKALRTISSLRNFFK